MVSTAKRHCDSTAAELAAKATGLFKQRNPITLRNAIELYEQALEMEPENQKIRADLALALAISVAWYSERMEVARRAEGLAREALAESRSFDAEFALAVSLDAQGETDPALAAYERAIALRPGHFGARASLAYLLQVRGRLVEALSHNLAVMDQVRKGELDVQVASCLRLLGFRSAASNWLERADRLNPGSAHAAPVRALDLITRGHLDQAQTVIDEALARGVQQVELYEYGVVLALLNDDPDAAIAHHPGGPRRHQPPRAVRDLAADRRCHGRRW